ncbi:MAG: hypothetical protein QXO17_01845 [Nitrososphaerota archaeon]|nr:hypothetical protein [Candidatus Calditenuis fumarioli]
MSGSTEEVVRLVKQARELVWKAIELADAPGLRKALEDADMMLHWSLWHLAAEEGLAPEVERKTVRS